MFFSQFYRNYSKSVYILYFLRIKYDPHFKFNFFSKSLNVFSKIMKSASVVYSTFKLNGKTIQCENKSAN